MDTASLNALEQAKRLIEEVDLGPVVERLVKIDKWNREDAIKASKQYRNYLFLRKKYPNEKLPPSKEIDDVWHAHVLHTRDYRHFCKQVFAHCEDQYLDHDPHLSEAGNIAFLEQLFENTQELYLKEFGHYIYQIRAGTIIGSLMSKIKVKLIKKYPHLALESN